jgi:hypothetical protein
MVVAHHHGVGHLLATTDVGLMGHRPRYLRDLVHGQYLLHVVADQAPAHILTAIPADVGHDQAPQTRVRAHQSQKMKKEVATASAAVLVLDDDP